MFNKINIKKIIYEPVDKAFPSMSPIRNKVPQWYKESDRFLPDSVPFKNQGLQLCVPFLDAMTVGYCVELMQDLVVVKKDGNSQLHWPEHSHSLIGKRPIPKNNKLPVPAGHDPEHYTWQLQLAMQFPKGYSGIFTHPLNRHDLPFTTLSGVIDGDQVIPHGFVPFFLKSDFEGLIPQGTPIIQIIPFKREDWETEMIDGIWDKGIVETKKSQSITHGYYKKNKWQKKIYK